MKGKPSKSQVRGGNRSGLPTIKANQNMSYNEVRPKLSPPLGKSYGGRLSKPVNINGLMPSPGTGRKAVAPVPRRSQPKNPSGGLASPMTISKASREPRVGRNVQSKYPSEYSPMS